MDILSSLNPKQKEAVETINGPVLVVAGPGSGKTKVLTHRVAYLIKQGILPENILAVTFTNKAAGEMKERIRKLLKNQPPLNPLLKTNRFAPLRCNCFAIKKEGKKGVVPLSKEEQEVVLPSGIKKENNPNVGTFHSVCARILRHEAPKIGYKPDFVIYDDKESLSLIKKILEELEISPEKFKPSSIQDSISFAKNEFVSPDDYINEARGYWQETIAKIYPLYQEKLKKNNALDFDDLLVQSVLLFKNNPDTLEKYQNKWLYFLVDEYQDTNKAQYELIKLLSRKNKNIFVVGDFDQAVYAWRGADFRNILNFEKEYPDAKTIVLEENYRSTQNILTAAAQVIRKNRERKEKKLWTQNPKGAPIIIFSAKNEKEEGNFIAEEIRKKMRERDFSFSDFAVLYRTNAQSRVIEESFLNASIPYKIIGSVKFYDRREIKDLLAYLKIIQNPDDLISLERIINVPPRGIGKTTFHELQIANNSKPAKKKNILENFNALLEDLRQKSKTLDIAGLLKLIIEKTDYRDYVLKQKDGETRWENIEELFSVARQFDGRKETESLKIFLEEVSLLQTSDEVETEKNLVNLMTLHCAKGLEFPVIFIAGCEEGIFPHSKSLIDKTQMEEERRLCYVGMTRAKETLYFLFADKRLLYGNIIANPSSRFLSDLPEELVEIRETGGGKYFNDEGEEKEFKYF
jgi:DNA helicase-2/ATP-dependent DNA helicase PcrA